MTIVESEETPLELESAEGEPPADKPLGAFTRPQGGNGWKDWLFTVDHKKIGIQFRNLKSLTKFQFIFFNCCGV